MKALIARLILGENTVREYNSIAIDGGIKQKVFLEIGDSFINVTARQFLFCLEPAVFGVWMDAQELLSANGTYRLYFVSSTSKDIRKEAIAMVELSLVDQIIEDDGVLILLKHIKTIINHISLLKRYFIFRFFYTKPEAIPGQMKAFAAAYSYPRKVRLVSFRKDDYYNMFPMDLIGDMASHNRYAFGLRNTNVTLERIKEEKKIVVCEFNSSQKDHIYKMGAHHSSAPSPINELPFKVSESKLFGFFIPEWNCGYKEVEITKTINLGSHTLLWGKVVHTNMSRQNCVPLYHIHYLLYLYLKSKGESYPSV